MDLLLIRHAQTHSNLTRALDTAVPGADLTELGEQQVRELAEALAGDPIEAVWCSPTLRTRRTAGGLAEPRGLDLRVRDGLVEVAAGDWEMSTDERHAEAYRDAVLAWAAGADTRPVPGGESGGAALARVDAVVDEVAKSGVGCAVVVSHGAILRAWCGARVPNVGAALVREHPLGNTGLVRLRGGVDGWLATEWDREVVEPGGEAGPAADVAAGAHDARRVRTTRATTSSERSRCPCRWP